MTSVEIITPHAPRV
jgi:hypothetical protein